MPEEADPAVTVLNTVIDEADDPVSVTTPPVNPMFVLGFAKVTPEEVIVPPAIVATLLAEPNHDL